MTRRLLTLTWVALLLGSCSGQPEPGTVPPSSAPVTTLAPTTTTSVTATTVPTTTAPVADALDWTDPTESVDLGEGWAAHACVGEAPLICVTRDGEEVGLVEAIRSPLERFQGVDAEDGVTALPVIAADYFSSLASDRAAGCGPDYSLAPDTPAIVTVAAREGLRFGFTATDADGGVSERNVQHATVDGTDLILFTAAAYAEGGCPGRDGLGWFHPDELIEFEPALSRLVAGLTLP